MRSIHKLSCFGVFAVASLAACGSKKSGGSDPAPDTTGGSKAAGSTLALTGQLNTSTALTLAGDNAFNATALSGGLIKCTYGKANTPETEAVVSATGAFSLGCTSGIPMVISIFDADGNPTCTLKFKVGAKSATSMPLNGDFNFGALTCIDGEAETPDLQVLNPAAVASVSFEANADALKALVNEEGTNEWSVKISKSVEIGADGKPVKAKSERKNTSRGKTSASGSSAGEGSQNFSMMFLDTEDDGETKRTDGKIVVAHKDPEKDEWDYVDPADVIWTGESFTIRLTEEKDIKQDFAQQEIGAQRGPDSGGAMMDPSSGGSTAGGPDSGPQGSGNADPVLDAPSKPTAPDDIMVGLNPTTQAIQFAPRFPAPGLCNSTKWKAQVNLTLTTATVSGKTTVCDAMDAFEPFDMKNDLCSKLPANPVLADSTVTSLGRSNVMECAGEGDNKPMDMSSVANDQKKNDPMCQADFQTQIPGGDMIDRMNEPVAQLQQQLQEITLMCSAVDAAIAEETKEGAKNKLIAAKAKCASKVPGLKTNIVNATKFIDAMKAVPVEFDALRAEYCASTTMTQQTFQTKQQVINAKMNGQKLQQYFEKARRDFEDIVMRDQAMQEIRGRFIMAPMRAADGTSCTIPAGANVLISFKDLKPEGTCVVTSDIIVAGTVKDKTSIPDFALTFMDKVKDNKCDLVTKRIKFNSFDEGTVEPGCWTWDGTKPAFETQDLPTAEIFKSGGGLQRMKMFGTATLVDSE